MRGLYLLKKLVATQKTVKTTKLAFIVDGLEKEILKMQTKLNGQRNLLATANDRIQKAEARAAKRDRLVQDHEELKASQRQLKRKINELEEKYNELRRGSYQKSTQGSTTKTGVWRQPSR